MRIALTLDRDAGRRERNDYVESLLRAGAQPDEILLLLPDRAADGEFDGLILGGGGDVDPSRYGQSARDEAHVEIDPARDRLDFHLFQKARLDELPVFGICRGLQVINVALGGTLIQDIPSERPSTVNHYRKERQRTRRDHPISIRPGTRLHHAAGASQITVNSRHHQAIAERAPGLVISAFSPDGLAEGIETVEESWLLAVQWHPENLAGDPVSERLFAEFLRAVRHRAPTKV